MLKQGMISKIIDSDYGWTETFLEQLFLGGNGWSSQFGLGYFWLKEVAELDQVEKANI
jgi:hypothetical protein